MPSLQTLFWTPTHLFSLSLADLAYPSLKEILVRLEERGKRLLPIGFFKGYCQLGNKAEQCVKITA